MRKLIYLTHLTLILYLLSSLCAMGQERQLELINPDGTVATDSVAVAVIAPGVYLDEQLALVQYSEEQYSLLKSVAGDNSSKPSEGLLLTHLYLNKSGLLTVPAKAKAKAVVAQNQHGFAFVPPGALTDKTKLRPWAKLKIDTSTVSELVRSKYQMHIVWRNNFAGTLSGKVYRSIQTAGDPFGGRSTAPLDWRFNNYVSRLQVVDVMDQTITVPPGEVTIILGVPGFESTVGPSIPMVVLGVVRTASGQTAEFKLPDLGSAHGQLVGDASLPNWSSDINQAILIRTMPVRADGFRPIPTADQLLADLPRSPDGVSDPFAAQGASQRNRVADAYARYFASAEGAAARTGFTGVAMVLADEQGKFTFDALPIGQYELLIWPQTGTNQTFVNYESAQGVMAMGSEASGTLRFAVKANELVDLGNVDWHGKPDAYAPATTIAEGGLKPDPLLLPSAGWPQPATTSVDRIPKPIVISPLDVADNLNNPSNPSQFAAAAQGRIEAALSKPVPDIAYNASPLRQVIDGLSADMDIPIVFNLNEFEVGGFSMDAPITLSLAPITLRSLLNLVLDQVANGELTFVVRDEVLLITTREDAARNPGVNYSEAPAMPRLPSFPKTPAATDARAAEIVERWLESAPENADRAELKELLETHLSSEFDANQQTRRAEIDRLQQLLEQSRTWLDQRQQQREAIIQRRVQELLK